MAVIILPLFSGKTWIKFAQEQTVQMFPEEMASDEVRR